MFAFFGLGAAELIVIGLIGAVIFLVVPVAIAVSATRRNRSRAAQDTIAELRAEIDELREEIAQLKGASTGIKAP